MPYRDTNREYMHEAIGNVIAPAIKEVRDGLVAAEMKRQALGQSTAADVERVGKSMMTMTFDGEDSALLAIIEELLLSPSEDIKKMAPDFSLLKFAAAASKTQQPSDVSPCYRSLKTLVAQLINHPETHSHVVPPPPGQTVG